MSKFELHPVDPGFTAASMEAIEKAGRDFVAELMARQSEMMERAIRTALVYVPTDQLGCVVDHEQNLTLTVAGREAFKVTTDMLGESVTVSGQWLMWPLVSDFGVGRVKLSDLEL